MKKQLNPLRNKVLLTKDGLAMLDSIKFGGELKPKVNTREWFCLVVDAGIDSCEDLSILKKFNKLFTNWLGSNSTKWRTEKSLKEKGYLLLN